MSNIPIMTIKSVDLEDLELIKSKLYPVLHSFVSKKLFITGGTGFFGKWLLETINYLNSDLALGLSVTILTRDPENFSKNYPHLINAKGVRFLKGDVRTFVCREKFDYIIHAATDVPSGSLVNCPESLRSTIINGTENVVNFANEVKCEKLLYVSSGAAYGAVPNFPNGIPETCDIGIFDDNSSIYSSAKFDSELFLKKHLECKFVIARCFSFCGPYLPLDGTYAFGNFIRDRINKNKIVIEGNGSSVRSYLYAADLIVWLLTALSIGKHDNIYNIGSNMPISISELACLIADKYDDVVIKSKSTSDAHIYYPSINKAKLELGVDIYTSLSEAISKTIEFELK